MNPQIVLLVLIALAALAVIAYSLLGPKEVWDRDAGEGLLARLAARKEKVLRVIHDLEQERESGTLEESEFLRLRNEYKRRAIEILREQDRLRAVRVRRLAHGGAITAQARQRVEALVEKRRVEKSQIEKRRAGASAPISAAQAKPE